MQAESPRPNRGDPTTSYGGAHSGLRNLRCILEAVAGVRCNQFAVLERTCSELAGRYTKSNLLITECVSATPACVFLTMKEQY